MRVALMFLVLALAGCADSPAGEETPEQEQTLGLSAPTWNEGDYWTFSTPAGSQSIIVTNATAESYTTDTDNDFTAYIHARSIMESRGGVSNLGSIRATDLAGSQGTDDILYYKWPMVDGLTWDTEWDQENMTVAATADGEGFLLEAKDRANTTRVLYDYSPETKWFTFLEFFNGTGDSYFRLDLDKSGENYQGEYIRYEALDILATSTGGMQEFLGIVSGVSFTELRVSWDMECSGTGQIEFKFGRKVQDNPVSQVAPDDVVNESVPCGTATAGLEIVPNDHNQWQLNKLVATDGAFETNYEILQQQRVVYQR